MSKGMQNKSVIDTLTKSVFILIIMSAITIGSLTSYVAYSEFTSSSKRLEKEYLSSQKAMLQREVSNVETQIEFERSRLNKRIRDNIKLRVYEAHAIATNIYEKYKNTKPEHEVVNLIKVALRPLRFFNGRGYIFITSLDGDVILHPITTQYENTNILNYEKKSEFYFVEDIINLAKDKGEGFYKYTWTRPDEEGRFAKVSFVKNFKPYNWAIGVADYVVDVERNIKQEILERIGEIQFGKEGYIFVVNYDGTVMMNRGNRSLIGTNILGVTDSNGVRVAEEIIKLAHDPNWDGYFNYTWKKLSSDKISPKVAYHKVVPEWQWYYGAGVYLDDVQEVIENQRNSLKEHLIFQMIIIAITIVLTLMVLFYIAQKNAKSLNIDLTQLLDYFHTLSIKSKPMNTESLKFSEFRQLSNSANSMLEKQKSAEEQNRKLEKQIQHTQKMEAVTQVVGGVAHDFNNLMSVVLGYGELLELKLADQPELEKYCHQINMAGKRAVKLTRRLLSLTHAKDIEPENSDINKLLNDEREFLEKSLTAKIEMEFDLKDKLWIVWIDRSDFEDVILNLCVNAMHAMKIGQQDSRIIISTDNINVSGNEFNLNNHEPGDYVKVSISDNGMGMDDEVKSRLFEPFYTTRDNGTGLGLSQVYSFVQRSGGTISVNSTPGEGSEFQLLFPRKEVNEEMMENIPLDKNMNVTGNETILVVDDEKPLRELSANILGEKGYRVLQAADGVEALVVLDSEKVDLIISDVIMPNMDGNILAERVKNLYPHIKIQLVSGYMKENQLSEINLDLYKNLLHKPVDAPTLLKSIRQLLD